MLKWVPFSEMRKVVHCLDLKDSVCFTAYSVEPLKSRPWTFHFEPLGANLCRVTSSANLLR